MILRGCRSRATFSLAVGSPARRRSVPGNIGNAAAFSLLTLSWISRLPGHAPGAFPLLPEREQSHQRRMSSTNNAWLVTLALHSSFAPAARPAGNEEFENLANGLKPGDVLILHGGTYETDGLATNPGWKVGPGFKQSHPTDLRLRWPRSICECSRTAVSARVDVFARTLRDPNRARGKLYMPKECSFYTRAVRLSRPLLVKLIPGASYRRAHRLQPARSLKKTALNRRIDGAGEAGGPTPGGRGR